MGKIYNIAISLARNKLLSPDKSWWIRSAKLGSSPHQNIHNSLLPGLWSRRQTPSTSALRQRLKLLKMGSSSVTGNRIGAEVGPCHTYLFHLIPVKSAWRKESEIFLITAHSKSKTFSIQVPYFISTLQFFSISLRSWKQIDKNMLIMKIQQSKF